jgi:hypothetical protein
VEEGDGSGSTLLEEGYIRTEGEAVMEQGRGKGMLVGGSSSSGGGGGGRVEEGRVAREKARIPYTIPPPLDRPSPVQYPYKIHYLAKL